MHLHEIIGTHTHAHYYKSRTKRQLLSGKKWLLLFLLLVARTGFAQESNPASPLVSLSEQNATLEKIFKKIQEQTSYRFLYENRLLEHAHKVSITVKNMPIEKALELCFANQQLGFKIVEKTIVIIQSAGNTTGTALQWIRASGTVVNSETGKPIQGASVNPREHLLNISGLPTNEKGYFDIKVPLGTVLVITCIGFEKQEITVHDSQATIPIPLKPVANTLNEVVVSNGYTDIDPRRLTSAITTLKAKDILVPGIFTIDHALEGRVPGLFVMNNSGEVGTAPKIRIRGTSTILGNQEPVWVVDGVVVNSPVNIDPQTINDLDFVNRLGNAISGLNPMDIEQIDVLKDASATALYGVRAANGVIVITTKKGHPGPPVISYSVSGTYTRRPRYTDNNINVMNSAQRIDYSRELVDKGLNYPSTVNWVGYEGAIHNLYNKTITYDQFQQQVHQMETMNTDWFGAITQDAISTHNDLSISGGTNKMRYFASVGVSDQPGTVKGDKVQQYTSTINLSADVSDRLQWNMNLMGNIDQRNFVASTVDALSYAYNTSRAIPAYNADGSLNYYQKYGSSPTGYSNYYHFNIINEMQNSRDISNGGGMRVNTNLVYKFSDALRGMVLFSYSYNNTVEQISYNDNTFYAAQLRVSEYGTQPDPYNTLLPVGGELQTITTRNNSYTVRGQVDYRKNLDAAQKHLLTATIGTEMSSNQYKGMTTDRRGYLPDRGETFAPIDPTKYPSYAQWALLNNIDKIQDQLTNLVSGYFTTSYTYNNRYTLNFNTRTDFSNKFGSRSNEKFLPTWSVSGRWDIAEDLFQRSDKVNLLALRASYGYQGNMLDNQTPNLIIRQGSADPVTGEYYSNIAYYPNPNLRWEKTGQVNTAVDFALFNNKLSGSLTYFYKKTTNAFLDKQIADINGRDTYVVNAGNLVNQGVEVIFSFMPINTAGGGHNGFRWRIDPQFGQVINKLIANALNNNTPNQVTGNANTYNSYLSGSALINGKAINTFYSYQFAGLSAVNGMPTFKNDDPAMADKYATMTNDQVYQTVMQPSGNRIATIQGGISNYFSYKNFSLSFNLTYSIGSKIRLMKLYPNATSSVSTIAPLPEENVSTIFLDRWRSPGDEKHTNIPGLLSGWDYYNTTTHWSAFDSYKYADNIWQMYDNSDIRIVSGNYLKIATMQFGYKLSQELLKKWSVKDIYLSLSGTNLYTFASKELHGQDPSQSGFSNVQLSTRPGYSFQIQVSF